MNIKNNSYNIDSGGKSKGPHNNSNETKLQISSSMKGKNKGSKNGMYGVESPNRIPIYIFDDNLVFIKSISSILDLSKLTNIDSSRLSQYLKKYDLLKIKDKYYSKQDKIDDITQLKIKEYKQLAVGVSQYDSNGNLIKHYKYTKDVCKTGLVNDNILRSHRNMPWKHNGFIWVFDDVEYNNFDLLNINDEKKIIFKPRNPNSVLNNTIVYKYDILGNYIKSYNCIAEVIKTEKITYNSLKRIHYGPWPNNNHIWCGEKYDESSNIDLIITAFRQLRNYTKKVPVFQFDENNKIINVYESLSVLKKKTGLSRDLFVKNIKYGPFKYKNHIWTDLEHINYILNSVN